MSPDSSIKRSVQWQKKKCVTQKAKVTGPSNIFFHLIQKVVMVSIVTGLIRLEQKLLHLDRDARTDGYMHGSENEECGNDF